MDTAGGKGGSLVVNYGFSRGYGHLASGGGGGNGKYSGGGGGGSRGRGGNGGTESSSCPSAGTLVENTDFHLVHSTVTIL